MKDRFKSAGDFFKVLDVNGDGVIQHEEFQRSMKKVFKGESTDWSFSLATSFTKVSRLQTPAPLRRSAVFPLAPY